MPPRPRVRPPTRLYLITPPVKDARRFAADLATALDAGGFAAVLLNFADEQEAEPAEAVAALVPLVQGRGIALLVNGSTELAARLKADGAHLTGVEALQRAIPRLKPQRIARPGGVKTPHEGMLPGGAGCDYVTFGAPESARG